MKRIMKINYITVILLTVISNTVIGQTWSSVGTGINDDHGRIESMCEYNGELYVGGFFDTIGGMHVNSLAKWDGTTWDSVPGMFSFGNLEIFDMVVYQNELVIVGNSIHKWNGTSWSNLGGFVDNIQLAVEVYNDELYITGHFENVDGIPTRGLAKWNGTTWSTVGGDGLNQSPGYSGNVLKVYNGKLYLAGGFVEVCGVTARGVARWDGSQWDSVGVSNYSYIQDLEVYKNKLYGRNIFDNTHITNIENWNDTIWNPINSSLNSSPSVLVEYNNELYAAGSFDTAGINQALCIARWNGLQWNNVGSGLTLFNTNVDTLIIFNDTIINHKESIYTMYVYNNDLYVGGRFTTAGGVNANSIAKWHMEGSYINEINNSLNVSIYPNPTSDYLTLILSGNISKIEIRIYSILNELELYPLTMNKNKTIDISSLPKGVYILEVKSGNSINRQKFIKI
jgi:trimeric autotransporter adhesin